MFGKGLVCEGDVLAASVKEEGGNLVAERRSVRDNEFFGGF
jgi:hypothetical protein